jgi:hypothetical protein
MDIAFAGRHTLRTYVRAVYTAYRPTLRYVSTRLLFAFALGSLYFAYQVSLSPDRTMDIFAPTRLIWHILAAVVLLLLLIEPFLAPLYIAYRLWRDPSVRTEWRGTVSARGITFANSGRSARWDAFQEAVLPPDIIILKTGELGFLALPRNFFGTDADWKKARALAESKIHPLTTNRRPFLFRR